MNKQEIRQKIIGDLNSMSPTDRIDVVYDLFTSDLLSEKISEPGTKVLRFKDLKNGEKFIAMPRLGDHSFPGSDSLSGGLKDSFFLFTKIQDDTDDSSSDKEKDNAKNLFDETLYTKSTMPLEMHVIRVV